MTKLMMAAILSTQIDIPGKELPTLPYPLNEPFVEKEVYASKLGLNADKRKYSLFYKSSKLDVLPLLFPTERVESIKFFSYWISIYLG